MTRHSHPSNHKVLRLIVNSGQWGISGDLQLPMRGESPAERGMAKERLLVSSATERKIWGQECEYVNKAKDYPLSYETINLEFWIGISENLHYNSFMLWC